jgi:hypothetical protein
MANINDNIRSKKLYTSGDTTRAFKNSNGEVIVPSKVASKINEITDFTEIYNDELLLENTKYFLKEIENMRQDIEELHTFIKDAFGKDSSSAASKGDTGATGPQGPQGATGATGPAGADGRNGTDGNDHLKNVQSIAFNEKSGQLEITIEGYKSPFRFNPAK